MLQSVQNTVAPGTLPSPTLSLARESLLRLVNGAPQEPGVGWVGDTRKLDAWLMMHFGSIESLTREQALAAKSMLGEALDAGLGRLQRQEVAALSMQLEMQVELAAPAGGQATFAEARAAFQSLVNGPPQKEGVGWVGDTRKIDAWLMFHFGPVDRMTGEQALAAKSILDDAFGSMGRLQRQEVAAITMQLEMQSEIAS